MLYLLGGAARSGKSIIARRILAEKRIPYFEISNDFDQSIEAVIEYLTT